MDWDLQDDLTNRFTTMQPLFEYISAFNNCYLYGYVQNDKNDSILVLECIFNAMESRAML